MRCVDYTPYNKTLFKVNIGGKWGIYDMAMNEIIPCQYDDILVQLNVQPKGGVNARYAPYYPAPKDDREWYWRIDFILLDNGKYYLGYFPVPYKLRILCEGFDELYVYTSNLSPHLTRIILVRCDKYWILLLKYSSYGYSPYDEIKVEGNSIFLRRNESSGMFPFEEALKDISQNLVKIKQIETEYCAKNKVELDASTSSLNSSYRKYLRSIEKEKYKKKSFDEQLLGYKKFLETRQYDK